MEAGVVPTTMKKRFGTALGPPDPPTPSIEVEVGGALHRINSCTEIRFLLLARQEEPCFNQEAEMQAAKLATGVGKETEVVKAR
jgi:hypothetical protein